MSIYDFNNQVVAQPGEDPILYEIFDGGWQLLGVYKENMPNLFISIIKTMIDLDKYGSRKYSLEDSLGQEFVNVKKSAAYGKPKFSIQTQSGESSVLTTDKMNKSKFTLKIENGESLTISSQDDKDSFAVKKVDGLFLASIVLNKGVVVKYPESLDSKTYLFILASALCIESARSHELIRKKGVVGLAGKLD